MPKPDIERLAESLKRSRALFALASRGGIDSPARAYGYLEMAVERFLQGREQKRRKAVTNA